METETNYPELKREDVRIGDLVGIKNNGHKYSWYNGVMPGVVLETDETMLTIKRADGTEETWTYDKELEEGVTKQLVAFSDIKFAEMIMNEVRSKEESIQQQEQKLEDMYIWQEQFDNSISFMGKMKKFIKLIKMED